MGGVVEVDVAILTVHSDYKVFIVSEFDTYIHLITFRRVSFILSYLWLIQMQ